MFFLPNCIDGGGKKREEATNNFTKDVINITNEYERTHMFIIYVLSHIIKYILFLFFFQFFFFSLFCFHYIAFLYSIMYCNATAPELTFRTSIFSKRDAFHMESILFLEAGEGVLIPNQLSEFKFKMMDLRCRQIWINVFF